MAKVQQYLESAKGAIVSGSHDRAIQLCQHVLHHYPKHLEAHCLLAEAYRERGEAAAAEGLFWHVLSADPENLIARWALCLIFGLRDEQDRALNQLRIALEVHPDHTELRNEVLKLGGEQAQLTAAGLANIYLRGGLFDRAAVEFRSALATQPKRLDLMVGLAETLWRDGRSAQAEALCGSILQESPDCLKAILIAAFIAAARDERLGDAEAALWRNAHALDPDNTLAKALAAGIPIALADDRWSVLQSDVALPDLDDPSSAPPAPAPLPPSIEILPPGASSRPPNRAASISTPNATAGSDVVPSSPRPPQSAGPVDRSDPLQPVRPAKLALENDAAQPDAPTGGSWLPPTDQSARPAEADVDAAAMGEWADLLEEEIVLDPAAEARLTAALSDLQRLEGTAKEAPPTPPEQEAAPDTREEALLGPHLRALEADPSDTAARLSVAAAYVSLGRPAAAVIEYRTLLKNAPDVVGQIADGLRELLRAQPQSADGHRALGDAYMKLGRFQQAIDEYNRALTLEKANR